MINEKYQAERVRLAKLNAENEGDREHPVFGEGNSQSPVIMFIGEAPGREEAECGRPFVGRAGKQLDRMLELAEIDRQAVFVTNTVKYRPTKTSNGRTSNRTPTSDEIREGLALLRYEIAAVRPRVIATLGNVPLSAVAMLADESLEPVKVGAAHGAPMGLMIDGVHYIAFPLYHPAASIYNRALKPVLEDDLVRLGELCRSL